MDAVLDPGAGCARIAGTRFELTEAGGTSLQLGGPAGVVLRPLCFGERSRTVQLAAAAACPAEAVGAAVLGAATVRAGSGVQPAAEVVALLLAGADLEAPPFDAAALAVAGSGRIGLTELLETEACLVDRLALSLMPDRGEPESWTTIRLVGPSLPATGADGLHAVRDELAERLLERASVVRPAAGDDGTPRGGSERGEPPPLAGPARLAREAVAPPPSAPARAGARAAPPAGAAALALAPAGPAPATPRAAAARAPAGAPVARTSPGDGVHRGGRLPGEPALAARATARPDGGFAWARAPADRVAAQAAGRAGGGAAPTTAPGHDLEPATRPSSGSGAARAAAPSRVASARPDPGPAPAAAPPAGDAPRVASGRRPPAARAPGSRSRETAHEPAAPAGPPTWPLADAGAGPHIRPRALAGATTPAAGPGLPGPALHGLASSADELAALLHDEADLRGVAR